MLGEEAKTMPSNLLTTDTSFPQFKSGQSDSEKVQVIMNYLFMLREQLQYSMSNMGVCNFNAAELNDLKEIILEDEEGNIGQLQMTAQALNTKFESVEGDISDLWMVADEFATTLIDTEGQISSLSQKVNSFTLNVSNGATSSTIKLMAGNTAISSKEIKFTGLVNFVTADQLKGNGTTQINGGNITTGKISAIDIEGCVFRSVLDSKGNVGGEVQMYYIDSLAGGIRLDNQGEGSEYETVNRMFIYTKNTAGVAFSLKLESAAGASLVAEKNVYIQSGTYVGIHAATNVSIIGGEIVTLSGAKIKLEGEVSVNGKVIS